MTKERKLTIGNCTLYHGDAFSVLPRLDKTCDAVISDPPYGMMEIDWDIAPPLGWLWDLLDRKTKAEANFVLFGCGEFAVDLVNSKRRWYRYDLVWEKNNKCGFVNANLMPMRKHEQILVFGKPGCMKTATYNPQKIPGGPKAGKMIKRRDRGNLYRTKGYTAVTDGMLHPCSVLSFRHDRGNGQQNRQAYHPTQKPLALMEWLVKTYTNEGDTVIDPFMGSGTTGLACAMHDRRFIGIEQERQYVDTAAQRIGAFYEKADLQSP